MVSLCLFRALSSLSCFHLHKGEAMDTAPQLSRIPNASLEAACRSVQARVRTAAYQFTVGTLCGVTVPATSCQWRSVLQYPHPSISPVYVGVAHCGP